LIKNVATLSTLQIGVGWFPENPGGLDRYFYELLRALPGVDVACRGLVIGSDRVAAESGGRVRAFASRGDSILKRWFAAREATTQTLAELGRRCLVSAHFSLYAHPGLGGLVSQGRPMVVHFHGPWAAESQQEGSGRIATWIKRRLENSVYRRADAFITLSTAFRNLLCEQYGIDSARVHVIPGGVDVDRFQSVIAMPRPDARVRLGLPGDRPIVLSVRRLVNRMGLENLIDAMQRVRATVPEALCVVVGRGKLHDQLQAQIVRHDLQSHVRLLGFVRDEQLPLVYRAADVTVMPSVSLEGFGLSAIESLASGTPVLVTPVGGLPEVVRELDPRLVMPGSDVGALTDSVVAALTNPAANPSAEACAAYARRRFHWPIIAQQVRSVYETALN
jgi:glycosyltransferase involved in cell wall biosynthesis